jgi:phage tail sheath protein FI
MTMPTYLTPGIYIEEISIGSRPIEGVGTSTAAFVGVAPNPDAHLHEAFAINNWSQFVREFSNEGATSTPLSLAVYGFFQNGGGRCYIVNVGPKKELVGGGGQRKGIDTLEEVDEVAIVAAPGFSDAASYDTLLSHCEKLQDRVAILDSPENITNLDLLKTVASSGPAKPKKPKEGEAPAADTTTGGTNGVRARASDGGFGAYYFPWLVIRDPFSPKDLVNAPPSGHIAGIYARNDASRGVHKAPANETVRGALDLTYKVTREEQGELNRLSVNCIRQFATQGIRVWGARTLADSASEWRYLNVRRLFNQIEESIADGTRWVVFEPNDLSLWKSIRRDVTAFLMLQWRQGALMGATPEEAFFVQCDAETNPPEVVDAGMVITVVGIAPVKPAEFVIFRIGQGAGGTQIETQGGA